MLTRTCSLAPSPPSSVSFRIFGSPYGKDPTTSTLTVEKPICYQVLFQVPQYEPTPNVRGCRGSGLGFAKPEYGARLVDKVGFVGSKNAVRIGCKAVYLKVMSLCKRPLHTLQQQGSSTGESRALHPKLHILVSHPEPSALNSVPNHEPTSGSPTSSSS